MSKRAGGPQTPRRYRDDAVLELVDLANDLSVIRTALKKAERALTNCEGRPKAALGYLRHAQLREDQLAMEVPA